MIIYQIQKTKLTRINNTKQNTEPIRDFILESNNILITLTNSNKSKTDIDTNLHKKEAFVLSSKQEENIITPPAFLKLLV